MEKLELKDLNIACYYYVGYESIIYLYGNDILKYFRDEEIENFINEAYKRNKDFDWYSMMKGKTNTEEELKNKEKKVYMLPNVKCLKDEVKVKDIAYKDGIFKGYTMEKCDYKPIDMLEKKKVRIEYLKMIKNKIEYLNSCGVFIGDFHRKNFLINSAKDDMKLCDLDNFRIDNLDFDSKTRDIRRFEAKCNKKEYIDSYCFNMFTLCCLKKVCQGYYDFDIHKTPHILDTKENRDIIESMYYLDNSYQKKYLIDNLR